MDFASLMRRGDDDPSKTTLKHTTCAAHQIKSFTEKYHCKVGRKTTYTA